jgi:predicted DNA-binding transcriptional regulator AlpA
MPGGEALMRVGHVAQKLGCSRAWIYRLVKAGRFPAGTRLGSSNWTVWPRSVVDRWIAENVNDNPTPPVIHPPDKPAPRRPTPRAKKAPAPIHH